MPKPVKWDEPEPEPDPAEDLVDRAQKRELCVSVQTHFDAATRLQLWGLVNQDAVTIDVWDGPESTEPSG